MESIPVAILKVAICWVGTKAWGIGQWKDTGWSKILLKSRQIEIESGHRSLMDNRLSTHSVYHL